MTYSFYKKCPHCLAVRNYVVNDMPDIPQVSCHCCQKYFSVTKEDLNFNNGAGVSIRDSGAGGSNGDINIGGAGGNKDFTAGYVIPKFRERCEICKQEMYEINPDQWRCPNQMNHRNIRQQSHYTQHHIQPVVFIGMNKMDFLAGNVIKYVSRYNLKNGVEDLEKAKHYLEMLIQRERGEEIKP